MTAIAYITDSKMLENHRLLRSQTMNFWRLSTNINFSDFKIGDLVFFLNKDRVFKRHGEKGIVGYGRLKELRVYSPNTMWKRYGKDNGYVSKKAFETAIRKVSKDNKLPSKISSMYLTEVVFFQNPTYLSEYGMQISKQVESYVYLNDPKVPFMILEYAKKALDSWSSDDNSARLCDSQQIRIYLYDAQKRMMDIKLSEQVKKNITRKIKEFLVNNPDYEYIGESKLELCRIKDNTLEIVFCGDKNLDNRYLIGQAQLYRYYLLSGYPYDLNIKFKIIDDDEFTSIINANNLI